MLCGAHFMISTFKSAFRAVAMLLVFGVPPLMAHEGHDHGAAPLVAAEMSPRAEASSKQFELVAIARDGGLDIYLDSFLSNEPIAAAQIAVDQPDGITQATDISPGLYRIAAPWLAKAGSYPLIFDIKLNGEADVMAATLIVPPSKAEDVAPATDRIAGRGMLLALGGFAAGIAATGFLRRNRRKAAVAIVVLMVGATVGSARADTPSAAQQDRSQRLTDGSALVPKATQRILAIRTLLTAPAAHRRATEMPGRIVPNPNASGLVQAAVGGRLSAPLGGFPNLGTRVKTGDILAYVTPPLQAIDLSDMRQRQGELDQQISIVERRVARLDGLVPFGAATRTQLDESRLELEGLKTRRTSLDQARRAPEALIAPVDGIIAEAAATAGQIASPNAIVYRIVDPERLWIEALSFTAISDTRDASARLGDDRTLALTYAGAGFADRNQSVPVNFAIKGDTAGLRLGQFVTVLAPTGDIQTGIAVPRASLVRGSNGQDIVYTHVSPERFVPVPVRVEPLNADNVLIASGLGAGMRVVTQGAELLAQIR